MRRRQLLGVAAGAVGTLAGCSARVLPPLDRGGEPTPTADCPAVLDVERTVCPDGSGPVAVERSSTTVSGDRWSLLVSVTNRSDQPIGMNPYAWSVFRRDGDRWHDLAPEAHVKPWLELAPGDRYAWHVTTPNGGSADADQRVVLDLSSGTYVFAVPFRLPEPVGAVAPFDVTR